MKNVNYNQSAQLLDRAKKVLAGGVSSESRNRLSTCLYFLLLPMVKKIISRCRWQ